MSEYEIGDRVVFTEYGHTQFPRKTRPCFGTVMGFTDHSWGVRVKPDGLKTVSSYHKKFWDLLAKEDTRALPTTEAQNG